MILWVKFRASYGEVHSFFEISRFFFILDLIFFLNGGSLKIGLEFEGYAVFPNAL